MVKKRVKIPIDYVGRICQTYNNKKISKIVNEIKEMAKEYNVKVDIDYG